MVTNQFKGNLKWKSGNIRDPSTLWECSYSSNLSLKENSFWGNFIRGKHVWGKYVQGIFVRGKHILPSTGEEQKQSVSRDLRTTLCHTMFEKMFLKQSHYVRENVSETPGCFHKEKLFNHSSNDCLFSLNVKLHQPWTEIQ